MEKNLHTNRWVLPVILIVLLSSCDKNDDVISTNDNVLIGTWVDTLNVSYNGYYINELVFDNTGSFTDKSNAYGIYIGQANNELSSWFVRTGKYDLNLNKIGFLAEKVVSWDSFGGGDPETTIGTFMIFENCTFTINNNILELNYITYPADAPETTARYYTKQNN